MHRLKRKEKTRRVTVALPLSVYRQLEQFAFYRIWSDSKAGVFLITNGLKQQKGKP